MAMVERDKHNGLLDDKRGTWADYGTLEHAGRKRKDMYDSLLQKKFYDCSGSALDERASDELPTL
jgi:hypothetical protein